MSTTVRTTLDEEEGSNLEESVGQMLGEEFECVEQAPSQGTSLD